ncbi:hypothetical protein WMF27_38955 [Sorangium sp. So ce281]|uniref:hypothetical protein n=1 Tax=unclassified Sorangium TaxID=2621164 RepID=UPI003F5F7179
MGERRDDTHDETQRAEELAGAEGADDVLGGGGVYRRDARHVDDDVTALGFGIPPLAAVAALR